MRTFLAASAFWMRPIAIFIAGNLPRGENHHVAGAELDRMRIKGDARQRRARLALPAGRDDHHFACRQIHDRVHVDAARGKSAR